MKDLADHLRRWAFTLRETRSHWRVLSSGVTWLTWLTLIKMTLPFCQNNWSGETGKAAGTLLGRCWENNDGGSEEVGVVETGMWHERVRWQILSVFWRQSRQNLLKELDCGIRENRSWGFWTFKRKEFSSTEMNVCKVEHVLGERSGDWFGACWVWDV